MRRDGIRSNRSKTRILTTLLLAGTISVLAITLMNCGSFSSLGTQLGAIEPKDICNCLPVEPDYTDYRHLAKHFPIPTDVSVQEITVNTILSWSQGLPVLPPDEPRSGRELEVFHVAMAYLQNASVNSGDCDVHLEISATADKNAPRVVVETPVDSEYCSARQAIQKQLARHGFTLDAQHGGELSKPLAAEVLGMAFEDFEHNRGSAQVATLWELHPTTVTLLP